jgi:CubicO group peptidase (beta-lactamase class C family)
MIRGWGGRRSIWVAFDKQRERKPHRGFLCYNTDMLNSHRRNETEKIKDIRNNSLRGLACFVVSSVFLATTACGYQTVPTEPLSSSPIYTVPSGIEIERSFPEETTAPIGVYGDAGLTEALAGFRESNYQGTILILKDGVILYEDYSGFSDVEREVLCASEITYEIGWITRQFTAVGIMRLIEEGLLDPDAPLSDYIPEYANADQMTIRMLLTMTSGIPDYLDDTIADRPYTEGLLRSGLTRENTLSTIDAFGTLDVSFATVLEKVQAMPLAFEPGTSFAISDTGYVFLAEIIARVSQIPYIHYMQKNILTPAGLDTASFSASSDTAVGYVAEGALQYRSPVTPLVADGGLRMSAKDLMKWMQAVRDRQLISAGNWELMLTPGEFSYGMGFAVMPDGSLLEKSDVGGFSSTLAYVPSADLMVIILLNRNSETRWSDPVLQTVFDYYGIAEEEEVPED